MLETDYNDAIRAHRLREGFKELWHQCQFDEMMLQDYPDEVSEAARQEIEDFRISVEFIEGRMLELYDTFHELNERSKWKPTPKSETTAADMF